MILQMMILLKLIFLLRLMHFHALCLINFEVLPSLMHIYFHLAYDELYILYYKLRHLIFLGFQNLPFFDFCFILIFFFRVLFLCFFVFFFVFFVFQFFIYFFKIFNKNFSDISNGKIFKFFFFDFF